MTSVSSVADEAAAAARLGLETRRRSSSSTDEERLRPNRSTLRTDLIGFVLCEEKGGNAEFFSRIHCTIDSSEINTILIMYLDLHREGN